MDKYLVSEWNSMIAFGDCIQRLKFVFKLWFGVECK